MSGSLPAKPKKKKRTHDDQTNFKRLKLTTSTGGINGGTSTNPMPFENTLSLPIQEALYKFREASEQELIRLRKEGLDPSTAINKLVEKMRTIESDIPSCFSRQELELVMEMAGINEEGATRALILRSELAKLRHDGFNHPEAINELSRRMKRLAGSKRRISMSLSEEALSEPKHRKKEACTTLSASANLSRVSFTQFPLDVPVSRKRMPDDLMLDDERWGLKKRPRLNDKDISDSEDSDSELYHFDDGGGEFSQDEEKDREDDLLDDVFRVNALNDIPLYPPFTTDYSPSSDEEGGYPKDTEGEGGGEYAGNKGERSIRFHDVKEEESDSDDAWPTPPTPTTTTTLPPLTVTTAQHLRRTQLPKTTKQRDQLSNLSPRTVS